MQSSFTSTLEFVIPQNAKWARELDSMCSSCWHLSPSSPIPLRVPVLQSLKIGFRWI